MSMTREEAIDIIENKIQIDVRFCTKEEVKQYQEALTMAITALRPVSREQVEKVWRGEWEFPIFKDEDANDPRCKCSECGSVETPLARHRFCPNCGAPMTDEAVQMVMERMEALHERNDE